MELLLDVTQKDIREGTVGQCQQCPIALALLKIEGVQRAFVTAGQATILYQRNFYTSALPKWVHDFVCYFDDEKLVRPFQTELEFQPFAT